MLDKSILHIPLLAVNLAALRTPRMQKEAITEYGDWVSREITLGNFSIDPANGEPIHSTGQNLDEHREAWIKPRPHSLVPVTLEDPTDDTWTSGNITKQGARLKQLRAFCGSDAAALVLLTEEAALYGVKPFTTEKGEKIGTKPKDAGSHGSHGGGSNPWGESYAKSHSQDEVYAERGRLMKVLGLKPCAAMAAAAGRTVTGALLVK